MASETYAAVHSRLRYERGPASAHLCSAPGCDRQAETWALTGEPTHTGPNRAGVAVRWSVNLGDYDPTCRPHNNMLDQGGTWTHCPNDHVWAEVGVRSNGTCAECARERNRAPERRAQRAEYQRKRRQDPEYREWAREYMRERRAEGVK